MQVFQKKDAYLGGMDEAIAILKLCSHDWDGLTVHALYDGDRIEPWETVMTIEGDYTIVRAPRDRVPRRARAAHADHDERRARARGGERQADHLHAGAARPPSRPDRRRLRGVRRRPSRRRAGRRHDRRAGVLVGRPRHRHRAARADRRRTAATPCSPRRSSPSGRPTDINITVLVDFENDSVRDGARGRAGARPAALGRSARHVGVARRPLALGGAGRLQADRRQRAARAQGARRARRRRLRAREDRRLRRVHDRQDRGVRGEAACPSTRTASARR